MPLINLSAQVSLILNDAGLFEEWKQDIRTMAGRIIDMRKELHRLLTEELKTPGNWDHIINQIGMFRCVHQISLERGVDFRDQFHRNKRGTIQGSYDESACVSDDERQDLYGGAEQEEH